MAAFGEIGWWTLNEKASVNQAPDLLTSHSESGRVSGDHPHIVFHPHQWHVNRWEAVWFGYAFNFCLKIVIIFFRLQLHTNINSLYWCHYLNDDVFIKKTFHFFHHFYYFLFSFFYCFWRQSFLFIKFGDHFLSSSR